MLIMFFDGITSIFFDKNEIVQYTFYVKAITKAPSEQQKILVNYLKECHKHTFKEEKNDKKRTKKEIDT